MSLNFLDFERPIAELEAKIEELRHVDSDSGVNIGEEIDRLRSKSEELTRSIFGKLTPWQIARLARHPQRPYTLDYLGRIFTEFIELQGDRYFAEDGAIASGMARLDGRPVVVVGHQKGRTTKENIDRSFGMPRPEGYRKALRLFELAERFRMPVITFIDTPGAYPGVGAEERGQAEAIARNLHVMSTLGVPILGTVIGEGGSGGALAIGVADCVMMLRYSTYSVISPEGCASILWKSAERAADAAQAMGITVGSAPRAGAHRPDHRGAPRRRAPRPRLDGRIDQGCARRGAGNARFDGYRIPQAPALRTAHELRAVQGVGGLESRVRGVGSPSVSGFNQDRMLARRSTLDMRGNGSSAVGSRQR